VLEAIVFTAPKSRREITAALSPGPESALDKVARTEFSGNATITLSRQTRRKIKLSPDSIVISDRRFHTPM